jgi:hypothetical protein
MKNKEKENFIKLYEKINQFNSNFICSNISNLFDLFKNNNYNSINKNINFHPLLLNYKSCLLCRNEIKYKYNLNILKQEHKYNKNIFNFFKENNIYFNNKIFNNNKKLKLCRRRFVKSTEFKNNINLNNKNINNNNNKFIIKYNNDSDTDLYIIKFNKIYLFKNG